MAQHPPQDPRVAGHHRSTVALASWWLVWAHPAGLLPFCCPLSTARARPSRGPRTSRGDLWPTLAACAGRDPGYRALGRQRHPAEPAPGQARLGILGASGPAGVDVAIEVGVLQRQQHPPFTHTGCCRFLVLASPSPRHTSPGLDSASAPPPRCNGRGHDRGLRDRRGAG